MKGESSSRSFDPIMRHEVGRWARAWWPVAAFVFMPGCAAYLFTWVVMQWPWPYELFPHMSADAVPLAMAKEVTGWWLAGIGVLLVVEGTRGELRE